MHILELPAELPVLTFDGRAVFGSSHWKLDAIDEYARGRPAAWIDDNLDEQCKLWAASGRSRRCSWRPSRRSESPTNTFGF